MSFFNKFFGLGVESNYYSCCLQHCCHYDHNTLINKNGDLVRVFRFVDIEKDYVMRFIQNFFRENHKDLLDFAFWFYSMRNKNESGKLEQSFFLVLVVRSKLFSFKKIFSSTFSGKIDFNSFISMTQKPLHKIDDVSNRIKKSFDGVGSINQLSDFDCKLGDHSELNSFLKKILVLENESVTLEFRDLSQVLTQKNDFLFEEKTCEIHNSDKKKFIYVFTIKGFSSESDISSFLGSEFEFLVSEVVSFATNHRDSIFEYNKKKYYDVFSDEIKEIYASECSHNISIFIFADDVHEMYENAKLCFSILTESGFSIIHHDVSLENVFWSKMPGNFSFIHNPRSARIKDLAGFMLNLS